MRMRKTIVIVEFHYKYQELIVEGTSALFFDEGATIPMTDPELLKEIKLQYGYNAIKILYKQKA